MNKQCLYWFFQKSLPSTWTAHFVLKLEEKKKSMVHIFIFYKIYTQTLRPWTKLSKKITIGRVVAVHLHCTAAAARPDDSHRPESKFSAHTKENQSPSSRTGASAELNQSATPTKSAAASVPEATPAICPKWQQHGRQISFPAVKSARVKPVRWS